MKSAKEVLSLLLVVLFATSVFSAAGTPPCKTAKLTVKVTSQEAHSFGVAFDLPEGLELISAQTATGAVGAKKWGTYGDHLVNEAVCTFTFRIPDDVKDGVYTINAALEEASDHSGSCVPAAVTCDSVQIIAGDVHNHEWDGGVVTKPAACREDGEKTCTCTVCKETKTEAIPSNGGHTWDGGVVTKPASCKEEGVKTYTCTVCKDTKTEAIPVNGNHVWDKGVATGLTSYSGASQVTYTCTVCGAAKTEWICLCQ